MSTTAGNEPLTIGGEVSFTVPGRELIAARVESLEGNALELSLLQAPRTAPRAMERTRCFLECVADEGIVRIMGEVAPCKGPAPADSWVRIRFTPTGGWQLLQRREAVRAEHTARVRFSPIDTPHHVLSCLTEDVSGGGLRVRGLAERAQVGDEFAFELLLVPGVAPITGHCRVGRQDAEGMHAVEFTFITHEDRDRLVTFAHRARERKRLNANLAPAA
jgi:hypothetical protein